MSVRIDRPSNPIPMAVNKGKAPDGIIPQAPPVDKGYWEQLLALFPSEVTAVYLAGLSLIPSEQKIVLAVWLLLGIAATIILKGEQTRHTDDPSNTIPRDKSHITIAAISFLIWAYAIGGFFTEMGWYLKWVSGLLVLVWTFAAPRILPIFDRIFVKK